MKCYEIATTEYVDNKINLATTPKIMVPLPIERFTQIHIEDNTGSDIYTNPVLSATEYLGSNKFSTFLKYDTTYYKSNYYFIWLNSEILTNVKNIKVYINTAQQISATSMFNSWKGVANDLYTIYISDSSLYQPISTLYLKNDAYRNQNPWRLLNKHNKGEFYNNPQIYTINIDNYSINHNIVENFSIIGFELFPEGKIYGGDVTVYDQACISVYAEY